MRNTPDGVLGAVADPLRLFRLLLSPLFVSGMLFLAGGDARAATDEAVTNSESVASETRTAPPVEERFVQEGIALDLRIQPLTVSREQPGALVKGQEVEIRFQITDTATGEPLVGLRPGAWMDLRRGKGPLSPDQCRQNVSAFIGGTMGTRAELDLNVYYVLALNADPSISVVDPLFGFGGSKLLALVLLESPGEDWVLTEDGNQLFVTMPDTGQIAVVDTATWKVKTNIQVGARPMRIAVQPDQKYVWVGLDGEQGDAFGDGVAVVDVASLEVVASLPTGGGHHEIAFDDDSRHAFITNWKDGTLSVIDVQTLELTKALPVGRHPVSVAYSSLSSAAYVISKGDGQIFVVDGREHKIRTQLAAKPGLTTIRFAPGDRLGFVLNSKENEVHVLDAATNRIVQTADVGEEPDQVTFTDTLAYIRSRGTELIWMIPLSVVGREDQPVPVVDFTGGQTPVGRANKLSIADGVVPAPEGSSVLVANPMDRTIYYYKEGMAAPMGSFQNYGREPRAVLVVDKSLSEEAPGIYSTNVKLEKQGTYDVAVFVDSPRMIHCFEVVVERHPDDAGQEKMVIQIEPLMEGREIPLGTATTLKFRMTDATTDRDLSGLKDIEVLTFMSAGNWQRRQWARPGAESTYEIVITPPAPGLCVVYFRSPSLKAKYSDMPQLTLRVSDGDSGASVPSRKMPRGES